MSRPNIKKDGKLIGIRDVAKELGYPYSTVYKWHRKNNFGTYDEFLAHAKSREGKDTVETIHETFRGPMTFFQVLAAIKEEHGVEISVQALHNRSKRMGWKSPKIFCVPYKNVHSKIKPKHKYDELKSVMAVPGFKRAEICWREDFQYGCKNYSNALWDLVDGKVPKCYTEDGTCYKRVDILKM